jgi:hypothetical protein
MNKSRVKLLTKIISLLGVFLTLIPVVLVFERVIVTGTGKIFYLFGTVILVFSFPFWINRGKEI